MLQECIAASDVCQPAARARYPRRSHSDQQHGSANRHLSLGKDDGNVRRSAGTARYRPPAKKRDAKGRPLSEEEVAKFIAAVPRVVGESAAASWLDLINGILESSLRLEEALELSWDDRTKIRPVWSGDLATLVFPGTEQKNQEGPQQLLRLVPRALIEPSSEL